MEIERTLVLIRERPLLDVLDLALVVVRRRPGTIGLAALAGIAPFAVFNAWAFGAWGEGAGTLAVFLWWYELPIASAPLTLVLGGLMFGHRPEPRRILAILARSAVPMAVVHGFVRFLPPFWVPPRLAFANEVLLLERGRWWKLWKRGGDLASGREGELFLLGLAQVFLTFVFASICFAGTTRVGEALLAEELTWDMPSMTALAGWRFQAPIWVASAFFAVARFFAYIDQRIRLEGWEVELRARVVGSAMEEARRW